MVLFFLLKLNVKQKNYSSILRIFLRLGLKENSFNLVLFFMNKNTSDSMLTLHNDFLILFNATINFTSKLLEDS